MKASSNLKQAAASIEQTLNAEVAQAKFFGVEQAKLSRKSRFIRRCLKP